VSPILVRPVREQFEHDRVIRILQSKYKRKYEAAINPGAEQNASVIIGELPMFPDLVLFESERSRKVHATIEVETTESINTLEAMAEWAPFSRLRTGFFLYVPAQSIDTVRRLCAEHDIHPSEIWTFHAAIDQVRFTMVHRVPDSSRPTDGRPVRAQRLVDPNAARVVEARPARQEEPEPAPVPVAAAEPPPRPARPRQAGPPAPPPARKSTPPVKASKPVQKKAVAPVPPRSVKPVKKSAAAKKPRAVAARVRPAPKKAVRKATSKRSVASKR
jgi:hypothetical protein